jgi:N-glycosidase YbiA
VSATRSSGDDLFYGADEVPYGCFSNFSAHGFDLDGCWWQTSEHYFQAQKFAGTRHADQTREAATALRAAELGRHRSRPLRRDWDRVKDDVMRRAIAAKFGAHADIRAVLLATGDEEIVEDTSTDHYWGRCRTGTPGGTCSAGSSCAPAPSSALPPLTSGSGHDATGAQCGQSPHNRPRRHRR